MINYDPHYCRALIAKGSTWDLHLSDWLRAKLNSLRRSSWTARKPGVVQQELTTISIATRLAEHIPSNYVECQENQSGICGRIHWT